MTGLFNDQNSLGNDYYKVPAHIPNESSCLFIRSLEKMGEAVYLLPLPLF
jgi:hypothetical protein